ncbi:MAG: MBL fold metallo-hydrolase [Oscillospiraceae bacterium]|jgi:phosphoribosyl 1,2-cyclic phosphodiesterase|nr:MBL fold metallo-hydrolase [Oscillospiraceae bacterium]
MKLYTFSSGSSGNAALVYEGGTYVLIDAGISLRRIKDALLNTVGIAPAQLSAVLITHEHGDHIQALPQLHKNFPQVPVYATGGTSRGLYSPCLDVVPGVAFEVGALQVSAFETPHDTAQSCGYRLSDGKRSFSLLTDLGHITSTVRNAVLGSNTVLLESNHDLDMLWSGPYAYNLQVRVAGDYGHLNNGDASDFALELAEAGTERLILGHLSEQNNTPERALNAVQSKLRGGISVNCAGLSVSEAIEI